MLTAKHACLPSTLTCFWYLHRHGVITSSQGGTTDWYHSAIPIVHYGTIFAWRGAKWVYLRSTRCKMGSTWGVRGVKALRLVSMSLCASRLRYITSLPAQRRAKSRSPRRYPPRFSPRLLLILYSPFLYSPFITPRICYLLFTPIDRSPRYSHFNVLILYSTC